MISQEDLKHVKELKVASEKAEAEYKKARQKLIDRHALGEEAEVGPYMLKIDDVVQNRVDNKKFLTAVAEKIGAEQAAQLKEECSNRSEYQRVEVKLRG